ncbi:MAG: DUF4919 domain-containing protein [bacterium]
MKTRFIIFIIIIFSGCSLFGPYNGTIYNDIYYLIKKNKDKYYIDLLERYFIGDTSLTSDEYKIVYYGSFIKKELVKDLLKTKRIIYSENDFWNKVNKEDKTETDYNEIETILKDITLSYPFNHLYLLFLQKTYWHLNNDSLELKISNKISNLVNIILKSGKGNNSDSPYQVVNIKDEYFTIYFLGYEYSGSVGLDENLCDIFKIQNKTSSRLICFKDSELINKEPNLTSTLLQMLRHQVEWKKFSERWKIYENY